MFSDFVITVAGKTIILTPHDMFMAAFSLLTGIIFWALLYFSRKRIVVLKKSAATEQIAFELSRIADALERIANRPADRAIAAAFRAQTEPSPPAKRNYENTLHSLFGRS